jgi:hypothetical protein
MTYTQMQRANAFLMPIVDCNENSTNMRTPPLNRMRKLTLEAGDGRVPHRLYDLSIEDLQERREKSFVLPSATDAMNYLGVGSHVFYDHRKPGKQLYSKKLDKKFAVRVEKNDKQ